MEDILKSLRESLDQAKESREKAKEVLEMGKEAGIDVSEQEARLTELSQKVDRLEKALEKRE